MYKLDLSKNNNIIQFLKFGVVGLVNTLLAFMIYSIMIILGYNYILSNFIAWIISVFNAYYWNARFVFKSKDSIFEKLIKTYLAYGLSFALSTIILYMCIELLLIEPIPSQGITLLITVPFNFIMNKYWTYKGSNRM